MRLVLPTPNCNSGDNTTFAVSSCPVALLLYTRVVVRTFSESFVVFAVAVITSVITPIWSSKSHHEFTGAPLNATILSPFLMPVLAAAMSGITLSTSAGMIGRMKAGSDFSIFSRLMSSGRVMVTSFPFLFTVTVLASAMLRKRSTSNFLNSFWSVPTGTSPSWNPIAFASVLNFIPIVMS
ncbi:unknown [Prevotella sp. CAG:592]|nr:unknown [Prevotella sp. CAG:592]